MATKVKILTQMTKLLGKQNFWVFSSGVEVLRKKITEPLVNKECFYKPRKFGNLCSKQLYMTP